MPEMPRLPRVIWYKGISRADPFSFFQSHEAANSTRFVDQIRRMTDTEYRDKTRIYLGELHLLSARQRIAQFHHVDRYHDHRKEELLDLAQINLIIIIDFITQKDIRPRPFRAPIG